MVVNWSCDHSKWPQEKQKSNGDDFGCHFSDIQAIFGHLGPFSAIFGQFWAKTQNCRKLVMWPLKMTARRAEIQWKWFRMTILMSSCHFRPFCVILGPLRAILGPKHKIAADWSCDTSKRSQDRNLMELVSDVTFKTSKSFWTILCYFGAYGQKA